MSRCRDRLRRPVTAGACTLALLLTACQEPAHEPATLAVTDARIWTGDPARPWAEAIASRGETIVAVGSAAEIESFVGRTPKSSPSRGAWWSPA